MANTSGKAYALTIMSPIKNGMAGDISCAQETLKRCTDIRLHENSPFAKVPNTYLARLFVLNDVFYESLPGNDSIVNLNDVFSVIWDRLRISALPKYDRLKSKYLVMSSNFHGDLDAYLGGVWDHFSYTGFTSGEERKVGYLWEHCVAFDQVNNKQDFIEYMKKCQLDAALFFNGSTDDSLAEQLKSLYVKQEFTRFAVENQGRDAAAVQTAYKAFVERVQPADLDGPSWRPGQSTL